MPLAYLLLGVFACATSVIWIKQSTIDPVLLSSYRLVLACVCLLPWAIRDYRKHQDRYSWRHIRDASIPGVVLALHFVTWISGARMTLASNGSLIVNLTPIVTPFFLFALMSEHLIRREIIATLVAVAGLLVLFLTEYRLGLETLQGDLICFGSMLLLALYLSLGRKYRHHPTIVLYLTPLYASAGLVSFVLAYFFASAEPIDWAVEWKWLALLTLVPTLIGHLLLNNALRTFRGQLVALLNMTQFVFAGTIAWLWMGELPAAAFYPAAALAMLAGVIVAWPSLAGQATTAQPAIEPLEQTSG